MKSTTVFFRDLHPKFGTVNYRADICTIVIKQNTLYLMAASEVVDISTFKKIFNKKISIRKQWLRADREKDTLKI